MKHIDDSQLIDIDDCLWVKASAVTAILLGRKDEHKTDQGDWFIGVAYVDEQDESDELWAIQGLAENDAKGRAKSIAKRVNEGLRAAYYIRTGEPT